jgi:hypothetical protein
MFSRSTVLLQGIVRPSYRSGYAVGDPANTVGGCNDGGRLERVPDVASGGGGYTSLSASRRKTHDVILRRCQQQQETATCSPATHEACCRKRIHAAGFTAPDAVTRISKISSLPHAYHTRITPPLADVMRTKKELGVCARQLKRVVAAVHKESYASVGGHPPGDVLIWLEVYSGLYTTASAVLYSRRISLRAFGDAIPSEIVRGKNK